MKKTAVIALGIIVIVAGVWLMARRAQTNAEPPARLPPVRVADEVVAEARVIPARGASLSFTIGGVAAEVLVAEGNHVAAGQVLVRLASSRQLAARVAQAEAALARAQAQGAELRAGARPEEVAAARAAVTAARERVQQAAAALRLAESDLQRAEQLYAEGALARGQVDQARAAYETALAGQDAGRAELLRARAQLDLLEHGARAETLVAADAELAAASAARQEAVAALADSELRAPFAGTVTGLDVKVGEFVSPGIPIVRLADVSGWVVETTDLTELSVARVREGNQARVTFDALPGLTLTGRVTGIRTHGENRQGDIVYKVTIAPDRHETRLYWNMTASVAISPSEPKVDDAR